MMEALFGIFFALVARHHWMRVSNRAERSRENVRLVLCSGSSIDSYDTFTIPALLPRATIVREPAKRLALPTCGPVFEVPWIERLRESEPEPEPMSDAEFVAFMQLQRSCSHLPQRVLLRIVRRDLAELARNGWPAKPLVEPPPPTSKPGSGVAAPR